MNDLLRPDQTETYALISYDPATQPPYGDALDGGLNLGLRLADPRYEQALAQGKSPVWHAMGQEASYASRHVLLVATTNLTGTL